MAGLYSLKKTVIDIGKRVYNRGYVAANDGNISVRLDSDRILITPTGVSKGFMEPDSLVICDMEGKPVNSTVLPSSEVKMHIAAYQARKDIFGIVHAHPPYATAFGITGIPLTQAMLPEVILTLGGIPLVEYGTPGTDALSKPLKNYLNDYDAFLMQNHGALTLGKDLISAYYRMETLEHFAHIAFVSHLLGKIHTLPGPEVDKLLEMRKESGGAGLFKPSACNTTNGNACSILDPGETVIEKSSSETVTVGKDTIPEETIRGIVRTLLKDLT
jgi:L-fuculose-phosphate aldolase